MGTDATEAVGLVVLVVAAVSVVVAAAAGALGANATRPGFAWEDAASPDARADLVVALEAAAAVVAPAAGDSGPIPAEFLFMVREESFAAW